MNMLYSIGRHRFSGRTTVGTAVATTVVAANMQMQTAAAGVGYRSGGGAKNSLNRLLHLLTLWIWLFCINFGVGKF